MSKHRCGINQPPKLVLTHVSIQFSPHFARESNSSSSRDRTKCLYLNLSKRATYSHLAVVHIIHSAISHYCAWLGLFMSETEIKLQFLHHPAERACSAAIIFFRFLLDCRHHNHVSQSITMDCGNRNPCLDVVEGEN